MKGGRTAPRKRAVLQRAGVHRVGFNEGGADCPPKASTQATPTQRSRCFNEGGADCPPKADSTPIQLALFALLQ